IAAPGLQIVLEYLWWHLPEGGLPADAVMGAVGDAQVRDEPRVEPRVHVLPAVDALDRFLTRFGIHERLQLAGDRGAEIVVIAPRDDAPLRLTAHQVHINVPQTHGIGLRA